MISRRKTLQLMGSSIVASLLFGSFLEASDRKDFHIVIVGGGIGGATAAKYMRLLNARVKITIVEPKKEYIFCPGSNELFPGWRSLKDLTVNYDTFKKYYRIKMVHQKAKKIDYSSKKLLLEDGRALSYDKLIVSPGPTYDYSAIKGYSLGLAKTKYPAAWHVDEQTFLLKKQIENLKQGGVVVLSVPKNPYRCPPAPYERATMIAETLREKNPTAKIIILDAKDSFIFQKEYMYAWKKKYNYGKKGAMIEWINAENGGEVVSLDAKASTLITANGKRYKADIINIIPPEKAAEFAFDNDLTDGDWCSVNYRDFSSTKHKDIYVIGDTIKSDPMPKTGYIASNQARVVVQAINDTLHNRAIGTPFIVNDCLAMIDKNFGATLAEVYRYDGEEKPLVEQYFPPKLDKNKNQELLLSKLADDWQLTFQESVFG
jgi:sulfide dehydrogenase [flavocytochrome c] flavoprotein subunit